MPDFVRAGALIKDKIKRTHATVSAWANDHGIEPSTMLGVVEGTYNKPVWCSTKLLWRIASALESDPHAQRMVVYEILRTAGMLPGDDEMEITVELSHISAAMETISNVYRRLAKRQHRETMRLNVAAPPASGAEPQEQAA